MSFLKIFSIQKPPQKLGFLNLNCLLSTWVGTGLLRPMPGTLGSFVAVAFGYVVSTMGFWFYMAVLCFLIIAAYYAVSAYERASEDHDDQSIVIDEVIGIMIAGIPAIFEPGLWLWAFLLFRFFDIIKPFPISWVDQKIKGAWGVLLDDILAGFVAFMGTATLGYYALFTV